MFMVPKTPNQETILPLPMKRKRKSHKEEDNLVEEGH